MKSRKTFTKHELEEIKNVEENLRSIFNREYIPTFLVHKANSLLAQWKKLTGWQERTENPIQEPIIDETRGH
jgi:hypothetical protein